MEDIRVMQKCGLCAKSYQMGANRYDGQYIAKYELNVCDNCYSSNRDGWGPRAEKIILSHLEQKGIPVPERNQKDWLPRDG